MNKITRRKFFTIAGTAAAAFGLSGKFIAEVFAGSENTNSQRWAMLIDLREFDKNPGLIEKAITACHSIHNVPSITNKKHEVKWIWKEPFHHAFIEQENEHLPKGMENKMIPLLCNHCDNPPCVSVCPTQATWRREDGIVMMDWHRCIGCRYCMAACPYGSRSFNFSDPRLHLTNINTNFPTRTKGVVEKCTFCDELLAKQHAAGLKPTPACVRSMEDNMSKAMVFGNLNDPNSEIIQILQSTYSIRRKPELGSQPEVYYIVGGV
jgi:Fe-S-cluster-containing dehydrogenase component